MANSLRASSFELAYDSTLPRRGSRQEKHGEPGRCGPLRLENPTSAGDASLRLRTLSLVRKARVGDDLHRHLPLESLSSGQERPHVARFDQREAEHVKTL